MLVSLSCPAYYICGVPSYSGENLHITPSKEHRSWGHAGAFFLFLSFCYSLKLFYFLFHRFDIIKLKTDTKYQNRGITCHNAGPQITFSNSSECSSVSVSCILKWNQFILKLFCFFFVLLFLIVLDVDLQKRSLSEQPDWVVNNTVHTYELFLTVIWVVLVQPHQCTNLYDGWHIAVKTVKANNGVILHQSCCGL